MYANDEELYTTLKEDHNAWWQVLNEEFQCSHDQVAFTKYTQSNGVVIVKKQCTQCGRGLGAVPKAQFDLSKLPVFDHALASAWQQKRQERGEELRSISTRFSEELERKKHEEWFCKYNQYLRTQQWHDLRQRVLERDNHLCQACLKRKATQAHHVSYELYNQLGYSAAFELVSICYSCHAKIHPHLAEAQHELSLYNPYLRGVKNGY